MVIKQRAMLEEDKQLRRRAILSAATALLLQHPDRLASVQDVALQSGLAKGTMYLYFRTKEEIYLAVHEQQTHQFFDTLEALLARERSRPSLKRLTRNVVEAIRQHPSFLPLAIAACAAPSTFPDADVGSPRYASGRAATRSTGTFELERFERRFQDDACLIVEVPRYRDGLRHRHRATS